MSKSDANPRSRILITDTDAVIHKKVMSALTDSNFQLTYDPANRPGLSNLIDILYHMSDGQYASSQDVASDCKDLSIRDFKIKVASTIADHLTDIRERYHEILNREDGKYLEDVAAAGASSAQARASATMGLVRDAVGL